MQVIIDRATQVPGIVFAGNLCAPYGGEIATIICRMISGCATEKKIKANIVFISIHNVLVVPLHTKDCCCVVTSESQPHLMNNTLHEKIFSSTSFACPTEPCCAQITAV